MQAIVAVDKNWAIGYKNKLLVSIPADMKLFRSETTGKIIVMGRKTLESFPQSRPLPNRVNVVLTKDKDYKVKDAIVVNSIEECLEFLKKYSNKDIFIIGGESIYRQFLNYIDTIHVTKIDYEYQADTYFPNLDKTNEWEITADSDEKTYFDLTYRFLRYSRAKKNA